MDIGKVIKRICDESGLGGLFIGMCLLMCVCSVSVGGVDVKSPTAKKLRSMARVYMTYGDYGKARGLAESAVELAKEERIDKELALCLLDLSYVCGKQNDFEVAGEMCLAGLEVQERVYAENHPYVAYTLKTLSSIYRMQGKLDKASASIEKAIGIIGMYHGRDDGAMGPFYVETAKVLGDGGEADEAEYYYLTALEMYSKSYGGEHLCTANLMDDIAEFYVGSERYFDAEPLVRVAMKIKEEIYGKEHQQLAETCLRMAKICKAKGDNDRTEKYISRALRSVERSGDIEAIAKLAEMAVKARGIKKVAMAR